MKKSDRKSIISAVKRAIIKIGSSVLTDKNGNLSESMFDVLAEEISGVKSRGIEVVIVSSGAIASGMKKLNLSVKPS
ncbi:MAG TPA: glutamate 5-kinase, partial [Thermodesulfobacteriota bacterium]|nr:glutamate 5-kinase [Thermodesulfobacteriota bacterium]